MERNSLSLLLSLNSSGLALAGGRSDLPLGPEMWILPGIQYLAQLAQHALFREQMALPT